MRKNGCPMSARDWQVDINSRAATRETPSWIRVKGVESITLSFDATTEDGSAAADLYEEPYVSKRSGTLSIEGRPVTDAVTGTRNAGQEELDYFATQGGCDGDALIKLTDAYGHSMLLDVVVTSRERSADDTEMTVSWECGIVGEPEEVPYVQATAIALTATGLSGGALSVAVGTPKTVTVAFTPSTASNQKYSVASADTSKVRVDNIDGLTFDISGVAATTSPVNVVVKSMNNSLTQTIAVTVTAT